MILESKYIRPGAEAGNPFFTSRPVPHEASPELWGRLSRTIAALKTAPPDRKAWTVTEEVALLCGGSVQRIHNPNAAHPRDRDFFIQHPPVEMGSAVRLLDRLSVLPDFLQRRAIDSIVQTMPLIVLMRDGIVFNSHGGRLVIVDMDNMEQMIQTEAELRASDGHNSSRWDQYASMPDLDIGKMTKAYRLKPSQSRISWYMKFAPLFESLSDYREYVDLLLNSPNGETDAVNLLSPALFIKDYQA